MKAIKCVWSALVQYFSLSKKSVMFGRVRIVQMKVKKKFSQSVSIFFTYFNFFSDISDVPYSFKLELGPDTSCWPPRSLYFLASGFTDKQKWVKALEAITTRNSTNQNPLTDSVCNILSARNVFQFKFSSRTCFTDFRKFLATKSFLSR